jgi:hypothetical protein
VRGQKPAISPKDRLKWLERLENGEGITSITKSAGRDIRVIKNNIELALEERQRARVRQDFLLGKLEQHQQDLLEEVRRLKAVLSCFPPQHLVPEDLLQKKIHDALKQHVKRTLLKDLFESWGETCADFEHLLESIKKDLSDREKRLKSDLPEEAETFEWIPSIVEALEQGTNMEEVKYYRHPRVKGQYHPYWGSTPLIGSPLDETPTALVISAQR